MSYRFDTVGWEDLDGNRYDGEPSNPDQTIGQFVHAYDPDSPEDDHYFWAFAIEPFESWDDWMDYIYDLMDMYGMAA